MSYDSDESIEKFQETMKKEILEGMTSEKFEKVLNAAVKEGELVGSDISSHPQKYNITYNEWSDFCEYLYIKYAPDFPNDSKYDYTVKGNFSDYRIFFMYKDIKFILRLLLRGIVGKESHWSVYTEFNDDWPTKNQPMKFIDSDKILISFI